MFALKKFDIYLDGTTFVIQTDRAALTWIQRLKDPAGRLARWVVTLQRYSYTVEYRKRSTNKVADALSRAPQDGGWEKLTPPESNEERGKYRIMSPDAGVRSLTDGWEEAKQPAFVAALARCKKKKRIVI